MNKPKLLIGGRQTGKSTKARRWLLENTRRGETSMMATRDQAGAKREFQEILDLVVALDREWHSLQINLSDDRQIVVGRADVRRSRGLRLGAFAGDPLTSESIQVGVFASRALYTLDSTEWDIENLDE